MNSLLVTIIVLNWNGLQDTRACLRSLQRVSYQPVSIIIIDNGSRNNEADDIEKEFGNTIQLVRLPENLGFAEGSNVGIRMAIQAGSPYVCLLNNDTTVDPLFLGAMVATAESDESIAMVAPTMRSMKDPLVIDNLGITLTLSGLPFNRKDDQWRLFCPSGGAVLYRSSSLMKVADAGDYFDPIFFAYAEDFDLGFRLHWQGFRAAFAPQALVFHRGSGSTSLMSDFALFHGQRNLLLTWVKNLPGKYFIIYGWMMLVVQCAHTLLFVRRHKLLIMLRAYLAAIKLIPQFLHKRRTILRNRKKSFNDFTALIEPKIVLMVYLRQAFRSKLPDSRARFKDL